MNLINARVKINDHHIGLVENVTPAEVIVLRHLHDKAAGGNCITEARKAGKALMHIPADGDKPATIRERSSDEEYQRLKAKYRAWSAPDKPGSSFLDDLFPGVKTGAQSLPTSFEQLPPALGLAVEILEAKKPFVRTLDTNKPEPINEAEAVKITLAAEKEAAQAPAEEVPPGTPEDVEGADLSGPVRGPSRRTRNKATEAV